ncbi:MAG: hypothetical protein RJB38_1307, partial [Pseudomonadota bacterium]
MKGESVKPKTWIFGIAIAGILTLLPSFSLAESLKHPRVAELEDSLRETASVYLKTRFPDRPFLVTVSVDPLRRSSAKQQQEKESLPYFDGSIEEIQDEWDDPQISLKQLLNRTQKIAVAIQMSSILSDTEVAEVKDSLMNTMHLVPARDEVQFSFRKWSTSSEKWVYPTIAVGIALLFLVGIFIIQRQSVARIATALKENKASGGGGGVGVASMGGGASMGGLAGGLAGGSSITGGGSASGVVTGPRGGMQVNDPIRARELMVEFVKMIQAKPVFPTLDSMILLEDYGARNAPGLGALLSELPSAIQTKLYTLGTGDCWFHAMNAPGMFGMEEIEIMQRLIREPETGRSAAMEETLIKVWRLGDQLPEFMRSFDRDQGLALLAHLPKGLAIAAARKAFPGAWAGLLDPKVSFKPLSETKLEEISKKAAEARALGKLSDLKWQKTEAELLEYLRSATPEEEREIYLVSKEDSIIHKVRPPFYAVLEAEESALKDFCPKVAPNQWALALFNVDREVRRKIQNTMGEKQTFMFVETLKQLNNASPSKKELGSIRETIAASFVSFMKNRAIEAARAAEL